MTVLSVPSAKSDKVPLVRDPTVLMESGGVPAVGVTPDDDQYERYRLMMRRGVKVSLLLFVFVCFVLLSRGAVCRAYGCRGEQLPDSAAVADDGNNDLDAAADPSPYVKSYPSYAAAEDDLLSSGGDYDAAGGHFVDPKNENVFKTFESVLLNKFLERPEGQRSDPDDVMAIFNDVLAMADNDGATGDNDGTSSPVPVIAAKSARFIHDFSVNVTGIVDVDGRRCFVMPLVRDSVSPPKDLLDLLFKMSSGYYSMDVKKAIGDMRVVKPAVEDLSGYGLYISRDCADYATYRLEKVVGGKAATTTAASVVVTAS